MQQLFRNNKIVAGTILAVVSVALAGSFVLFRNQSAEVEAAEWFNESWLYRQKLTIDPSKVDADLTNFPVAVQFTSGGSNPYSNTNSDGSDLRFTDNDGNLLTYEIETWNESGTSTVWVKVPTVYSTASTSIFIYYGNPSAQDAQDPENV